MTPSFLSIYLDIMSFNNHELQSTLQALGYFEDGKYYKTKDCLNAAKDLLRYLRRDDENQRSIRIELLKCDTISNDLIQIIKSLEFEKVDGKQKIKKDQLFDVVLRLLVNLTQSSAICYDFKIPEDKIENDIYIKIDLYLKTHKEAFADVGFLKYLCVTLKKTLEKNWKERDDEDENIIERILLLLRNILAMKFDVDNASKNLNAHDKLILAFEKADLLELLIKICNSKNELKHTNYLIECLKLILKDQNPSDLALSKNDETFSVLEKEKDCEELKKIKSKEDYVRVLNKKKLNPRHSRFAGTYTAVNMKALNDNNFQIFHKSPANDFDDLLDDSAKRGVKQKKIYLLDSHKNSTNSQRVVIASVRKSLHHFCDDFLKRSYNVFMTNCYDMMKRNMLLDNEIAWYYWLAQFFMEFTRNLENVDLHVKYERVRATFSLEMFHSLEGYITRCIEMFRVEKKEVALWIKRMHKAVKLFKECLLLLKLFDGDENEVLQDVIRNLKLQIFSIPEFREFFTRIFKDFTKSNLNISLLRALVEANQVFFEIFEKQTLTLVKPAEAVVKEKRVKYTIFDTYANEIFDALKIEFDPSSGVDGDQSDENIYKLLNDKEFKEAVNMFRQARRDGDGVTSMVDEFDKLKEIYMKIENEEDESTVSGGDNAFDDADGDNLLDFQKFLYRYTNPQIVKLYVNIFGEYSTNTEEQTRCCLKMFKYLSEKIEFPQIFYQLSLFNIINKFNKDPLRRLEDSKELYQEAIDLFRIILKKFFTRLKENPDLYFTLMFEKSGEYLDEADGELPQSLSSRRKKKSVIKLNTKYDESLIDLYCKYSVDLTDENEILDKIIQELDIGDEVDGQRKRILKRMVELNLLKSEEMVKVANEKKEKKTRINKEWSEGDYEELKGCYERLKEENCEKIVDTLKKCLKEKRDKKDIVLKLLEQKIILSKKELYKQRSSKKKQEKRKQRSDDDDDDDGDDKNDQIFKSAEFVRSSADESSSSSSSSEQEDDEDESSVKNKKSQVNSDSSEEEKEEEESSNKKLNSNSEEEESNEKTNLVEVNSDKENRDIDDDEHRNENENFSKKRSISPETITNKPKRQRLVLSSDDEDA